MPRRASTAIRDLMTALRDRHRRRSDEWTRRIEGPVHRYPHRTR
jgi:hypothetical protein